MLANLSPLLLAHLVAACLAMPLGLYQMLARQGTPGHALAGRLYVPAMLVCNIGALASFRPDTKFCPSTSSPLSACIRWSPACGRYANG